MGYNGRGRGEDGVEVTDNAYAIRGTEKALLVEFDGEEHWVPHSVIHDDSEVYQITDTGKLVIKRWWAQKQGWEP